MTMCTTEKLNLGYVVQQHVNLPIVDTIIDTLLIQKNIRFAICLSNWHSQHRLYKKSNLDRAKDAAANLWSPVLQKSFTFSDK